MYIKKLVAFICIAITMSVCSCSKDNSAYGFGNNVSEDLKLLKQAYNDGLFSKADCKVYSDGKATDNIQLLEYYMDDYILAVSFKTKINKQPSGYIASIRLNGEDFGNFYENLVKLNDSEMYCYYIFEADFSDIDSLELLFKDPVGITDEISADITSFSENKQRSEIIQMSGRGVSAEGTLYSVEMLVKTPVAWCAVFDNHSGKDENIEITDGVNTAKALNSLSSCYKSAVFADLPFDPKTSQTVSVIVENAPERETLTEFNLYSA